MKIDVIKIEVETIKTKVKTCIDIDLPTTTKIYKREDSRLFSHGTILLVIKFNYKYCYDLIFIEKNNQKTILFNPTKDCAQDIFLEEELFRTAIAIFSGSTSGWTEIERPEFLLLKNDLLNISLE